MNHDALWRTHAACSKTLPLFLLGLVARVPFDPDLWFTEKGGPAYNAKRLCAGCPVRVDCLQAALLDGEEYGIWGGAGDGLRRSLGRQLKASAHPDRVVEEGCDCSFHRGMRLHFRRLDHLARTGRTADGRVNFNGPGVTHGKKSTFKRGCDGDRCRMAVGLRPRGIPCPGDDEATGTAS